MKSICFYHNADLDGICSGAIIKRHDPNVELYGINYGDPFPWDKVANAHVYMVDFSLQPFDLMHRLANSCSKLTWIDHHKSAIEEAENSKIARPTNVTLFLDSSKAACELCWEFANPSTPVPLAVHLLGRYDVWDHKDKRVLPFQYGARRALQSPEQPLWGVLFCDHAGQVDVNSIIQEGKVILDYQAKQDEVTVQSRAFETELAGLRVIACNTSNRGSHLFDSVYNPQKHDVMAPFGWVGEKGIWTVSLYSAKPEVDCSAVAKQFGGGGHKVAAGFQCTTLPFKLR